MCGIAGEIRFDSREADASAVGRMADALRPRGPDGGGAFQQGRVAFAHRRLKIICEANQLRNLHDAQLNGRFSTAC